MGEPPTSQEPSTAGVCCSCCKDRLSAGGWEGAAGTPLPLCMLGRNAQCSQKTHLSKSPHSLGFIQKAFPVQLRAAVLP